MLTAKVHLHSMISNFAIQSLIIKVAKLSAHTLQIFWLVFVAKQLCFPDLDNMSLWFEANM